MKGEPQSSGDKRILTVKQKKKIGLLQDTARATTTSQPTNRAPNEPAMDKNANFGLNLVVLGQKIFFLLEKSKVWLPT